MPDTFEILSAKQQSDVTRICRLFWPQAKTDGDVTFEIDKDGEQKIIIKGKGRSWSKWDSEVSGKLHHYSEYIVGEFLENGDPKPRPEKLTTTTDKAEMLLALGMGVSLSDKLEHHLVRANDLFWSRGIGVITTN